MNGKSLKSNADMWQDLKDVGYFTGEMPANIDELPDDIFVNIHRYLMDTEDEVENLGE